MRNIALELRFDGTNYHGWQTQENALTVQELMTDAAEVFLNKRPSFIGCSRTDAGVHANRYICAFKCDSRIPCEKMPFVFNSNLPDDISVLRAFDVSDDFHPIFDCLGKEYEYKIFLGPHRDPFLKNRAWHCTYKLDASLMQSAADLIVGKRDFSAFMATGSQAKTTVRDVKYIKISEQEDGIISVRIYADGFLYNMVRIIVGTLVYVSIGKIDINGLSDLIKAGDRTKMGITAPPQGLYLNRIDYAHDTFQWR